MGPTVRRCGQGMLTGENLFLPGFDLGLARGRHGAHDATDQPLRKAGVDDRCARSMALPALERRRVGVLVFLPFLDDSELAHLGGWLPVGGMLAWAGAVDWPPLDVERPAVPRLVNMAFRVEFRGFSAAAVEAYQADVDPVLAVLR